MAQESVMVVCNVYRLLKSGNSFIKDGMRLERSNIAIPRGYVEEKNHDWELNGLWHEKDEEATEIYYEQGKLKRENRAKAEKVAGQLRDTLTKVLEQGSVITKKEVIEDDSEELETLKAEYLEKFGKKAHHLWKVDKLKEKLQ